MMEIKRILFPTDFSEGSSHALEYAIDMAKRYGAKLYLLHVIYDVVKAGGLFIPHASLDEMYKDIEKAAKKEIDRYGLEQLRGQKDVQHTVLKGTPHEEIVKFAKDNRIDLIIMGSTIKKGVSRILFGSTATPVVRHSPCPVLIVRLPMYQE
ncbi:MAG: universal stress protein [Nitrospirota bacterium]